MEKISRVILSLGSNIEDRLLHLKSAITKIEKSIGVITKKSSVYESEALGFESEISFYNICIEIETTITPIELLHKTQEIEIEIGRTKKTKDKYESRKIDIDIVFFDDEIINSNQLQIPHISYQERKFVLIPLIEILPEKIDPKSKGLVIKKLEVCNDKSSIKKINLSI